MNSGDFNIRVEKIREFQHSGGMRQVATRREILKKLQTQLKESHQAILQALWIDLHKSEAEAIACELALLNDSLRKTISRLRRWTSPKRVCAGKFNFPAKAIKYPEAYGTVLIGGTWNYPVLLTLEPLIGAIAAGNCAVVKLSDTVPNIAKVLLSIIEKLNVPEAIFATNDDWDTILSERYDYIFFTGGERLGKVIMAKAAQTLTPLTLELGGKSPCIVTEHAHLKSAARRIVWGKFLNAGQTCVAPDYLYVQHEVKEKLMLEIRRAVKSFFGDIPQESNDFGRIVNEFHYKRLVGLVSSGRLICGGENDPLERYIAPTVIDMVDWESPLMQQEIFGPILPVLEFDSLDDVLTILASKPKPLALYLFSTRKYEWRKVAAQSSAGGMAINETVMQLSAPGLPFGGIGASGMGAYHGKSTFDTFSHYKSILCKRVPFDFALRFPPFSGWKLALMRLFGR